MKSSNEVEKMVWERLSQIPDPEVPAITITELGVVREVAFDGEKLSIIITPTYTGCPAMNLFVAEIRAAMHAAGFENLDIRTVFSPAWTTDWLSESAKLKLKKYGIAPPVMLAADADPFALPPPVPCPHCDSSDTRESSHFGATACKSLYVCNTCREPFEYFKHF